MKKLTKSICCSALLCGAIMLGGLGTQSLQAQADVNNAYFMMEGTSVRLDASNPGLRFTAKLGTDWYEVPVEATETVKPEKTVSYGVFIFPLNVMQEYNLYNVYDEKTDYLSLIREKANDYFVYMQNKGASAILDLEAYPVAVDDDGKDGIDYYRINGSITNILYNNLNRDFFGLAYKKTGTFDAQTETYNYEYTYASYQGGDGSSATNVYNIAYVASCVYNMNWEGKTQADKDLLQGFVNNALQKAGGVAEKEAEANPNWDIELSQTSMTLNQYDNATLSFKAKLRGENNPLSLGATYTSSDTSVVKVDNKGKLTAVGPGSSTITVKCMEIEKTCTVTVQSALEFRTIEDKVGPQGGGFTTSLSQDNISITVTPGSEKADYKGRLIKFDTITKNKISLTVSNANDSNEELQLVLRFLKSENINNDIVDVTGYSGDNAEIYEQYGHKYLLITLAKGASTTVTATLATEKAVSFIELRPFILAQTYTGSFTVGEIYDGERPTGPVAHNVKVNDGSANPASALAGETVTLTPNVPEGYKFDRWEVVTGGVAIENNQFVMPNANVEITAIYTAIEYTVKVNDGSANPATATIGETVTLTAGEAPAGQMFAGWKVVSGKIEIVGNQFVMPASNVEVTAIYQNIVYYTVTVNNGTADPSSAAEGTVVTLTPNPAPDGQAFSGWEVQGITIENNQFVMPNHDVEITAIYQDIVYYTITVTDGSASPESAIAGTTVTLTPNVPDGKIFARWEVVNDEIEIVDNQFVMPNHDVEIKAVFQENLTFAKISEATTHMGGYSTIDVDNDKTSVTVTTTKENHKNEPQHSVRVKIDLIESHTISFKVTNHSTTSILQLALMIENQYTTGLVVTSATNATVHTNSLEGSAIGVDVEVAAGESVIVTLTWTGNDSVGCLQLRPFAYDTNDTSYQGSFTVSEIYGVKDKP